MINKLDLLSPPITLFYLEKRTHTSRIGGSLILLLICLCSSYIIYLLYLVIAHKKVTSLFYKKFQYDVPKYSLNSSSIYFFIQFHSMDNESYHYKYASKYVRTYTYYGNSDFDESNLDKIDHWVYDTCIDGIDNKNIDPDLFKNINNFGSSACLKYYYNSKNRNYYSLGDKEFIWPYLAHGTAQKNNIFIHTSIQKCTNDSIINKIFNDCPSQKEIDEYATKIVAIFLYLIDNQVDPTNYSNPIQQYMQSITSGVGNVQSFEETYIFYSPLKVRTIENSFFETINDLESFYFDSNVKISTENDKYFKYARFTHFIQNNIQIYERRYYDFYEILSDIGGIIQCVFNCFYWLNYFYNKYIIVTDTNKLFFSIIEKRADSLSGEKLKKLNRKSDNNLNESSFNDLQEEKKTNTIFENIINKCNNNNKNIEEKYDSNSSNHIGNKEDKDNNFKLNLIPLNKKKKNKSFMKINSKNEFFKENQNHNTNNNIFITNKIKELHYHSSKNKSNFIEHRRLNRQRTISFSHFNPYSEIFKNNLANQTIKLSKLFKNKIKLKKEYNFYDFLKSVCSSKINNINFLIKYRKCLLSEENVLKSHINNILVEKKLSIDQYQNINLYSNI